jgi:hypothetical protein
MKITTNRFNTEPVPDYTGKARCADVTPSHKQQGKFGEREVFQLDFQLDLLKTDGSPHFVRSMYFTPSLHEKSNFRKFLRAWFGRDLTQAELDNFDTESLIGKQAQLVVVQEHKDGKVYAKIVACTPDKSGTPLQPWPKYVRVKDRPPKDASGYRRMEQPTGAGEEDQASTKVHAGACSGLELRDLAPEQVRRLVENWLPTAKANPKPSADDRRLMAALEWWIAKQHKHDDDVPY